MTVRLKEKYKKEAVKAMMDKFGYDNALAVPKIEKVVINSGFGKQAAGKSSDEQKKIAASVAQDLVLISGQKPILTRSKKAISGFKLRQGMVVGAKVTLRKRMMYDFLERLIHIALPRSRDFWGIDNSSFDKKGNLTLAVKEQIAFPEVSPEKSRGIFGLEVTVVTNAKTREEGVALLRFLGFPIKEHNANATNSTRIQPINL